MKAVFLISLLLCLASFNSQRRISYINSTGSSIQGKWAFKKGQIQYVVDSHLVHEEEEMVKKEKILIFDSAKVRIENPTSTSVEGTYQIFDEDNRKKIIIQLPGTTNTYNLIALTSTSMVWQQDLDDTSYQKGSVQKSAERAIYTQEYTKL